MIDTLLKSVHYKVIIILTSHGISQKALNHISESFPF